MESNSIMVPGTGEKKSLETLSCFVENAPWRKLIARKQKWACTFGKAYLKYEIGAFSRAPSKKNQQMTKLDFFLFATTSLSKNEVFTSFLSSIIPPEAGHTQFTRPILL